MSKIIVERRLKEFIKNKKYIINGKEENAEGIKYDFRLGKKILKAKFNNPIDIDKLPEGEKKNLVVEPGEVVFVLTEEKLKLPVNIIAHLIPKRKISHEGILILGGFCIDPLYEGHLLIGLYNFSSENFPLRPGKKLIAATFCELDKEEIDKFTKPLPVIDDFPDELVLMMKKYSPVSTQGVLKQLNDLKIEIKKLCDANQNQEKWFVRFEENLERQFNLIKEEREARIVADQKFENDLRRIIWKVAFLSAGIAILASLTMGYIFNVLLK